MPLSAKIRREIKRILGQIRGLYSGKKRDAVAVPPAIADVELRLDAVVRELVRLQMQFEQLQETILADIESRSRTFASSYARSETE